MLTRKASSEQLGVFAPHKHFFSAHQYSIFSSPLSRHSTKLGDSFLRIFEGGDLRPLAGWSDESLFVIDLQYPTPLKTWRQKIKGNQWIASKEKTCKRQEEDCAQEEGRSQEECHEYFPV